MDIRAARWLPLALTLVLAIPASANEDALAPATVENGVIVWSPEVSYVLASLDVRGPQGLTLRRAFEPGQPLTFDPAGVSEAPMPDGFYVYDLMFVTGDETLSADGERASTTQTQSGSFEVAHGHAVDSGALAYFHTTSGSIDGSLCVGLDCLASEAYGFDTIRLKENNLRIHFNDTSSTASYPTNDWEIRINDSSNGGGNYFGIVDRETGNRVFRVDAGTPNNALRIDSQGDVGLGEGSPAVELHIRDGNTPAVRLDQDGSSGFTSQRWDVAGNETNFFVRDVTNGSTLPLRIRPGASSSALFIDSDDDIGLGTSSPDSRLHLRGAFGGDASKNTLRIQDTTDGEDLFTINGDGVVTFGYAGASATSDAVLFRNETTNEELISIDGEGDLQARGNLQSLKQIRVDKNFTAVPGVGFRIRDTGTGLVNFQVAGTGEVTSLADMNAVAFNATSDVNRKENIAPVDVDAVLAGVVGMPIATWEFIGDDENALHLGPMAQDFAAAFGLGANDTQIATVDADGVALASIQALHALAEADAARITALEAANAALEARLARLEALLGAGHE